MDEKIVCKISARSDRDAPLYELLVSTPPRVRSEVLRRILLEALKEPSKGSCQPPTVTGASPELVPKMEPLEGENSTSDGAGAEESSNAYSLFASLKPAHSVTD